ncbi:DNA damage-inducible protein 1-like [Olea europaea var. sylvestris]|uniref:DNA damage-inducible protein 1-like n=1 Tax=Olea europaea var. sylvestris TaxID=158386 RepID=UPI000C1D45D5|nr:DNA damage-inducible protein 1-like [Olea europaea var. sylvestris]
MKITVMTADEQILTLDVDRNETVENLKVLLEVETQVPLQQQELLFNGKEMSNSEKLGALGVTDGDLVMMVSNASSSGARASPNEAGFNPDGSAMNPSALQQQLRNDSNVMAQLFQSDPELAQAILGNDLNRLQDILRSRNHQRGELRRQQEEEMALLHADPFDVEAQKKIEAAIRQKGIDENWAAALEYNPEAFARVVMLYVDMEVNSVPLKAFVDSGAQSTIISKSCAERCGLLRLLDTRYRGIAQGVGQTEIIGRIHVAPIKVCMIPEKDIPSNLFNEERLKEASSSVAQATSVSGENINTQTGRPSATGSTGGNAAQGRDFEAKVAKLVELGFGREQVIQALKFFDGNEEQAAGFLFGG